MKPPAHTYTVLGPLSVVNQYRSTVSFLIALAGIVLIDLLAAPLYHGLVGSGLFGGVVGTLNSSTVTLMDFAPEVWVGVLALVLGTLIIVISIASQSTPKLIDLYLKDWTSLIYIWFLTLSLVHNIYLQFALGSGMAVDESSIVLSTCIFFPVSMLLAVPYIYYILRYSRTGTVIEKIHGENLRRIHWMKQPSAHRLMAGARGVGDVQYALFESLNQLDDLLEYVSFKEPKGEIIRMLGTALQEYVSIKKQIPASFFAVSERVREDISFKTLIGQFEDLEASRTIYEQKGFRLLGNAYMRLLESWDFDLSALCVFEITEVGRAAVLHDDDQLIDVTLVRLNTILRTGIKHGVRNSELRNLYNAIFHYSELINFLVSHRKVEKVNRGCGYLKIYGSEIYRISRQDRSFAFMVDVIISELKKILIHISEQNWPVEQQAKILSLMLEMDNMPGIDRSDVEQQRMIYENVRKLQIALALHYIRTGRETLSDMIIDDILEDLEPLGEALFRLSLDSACHLLQVAGPKFWEDTDRGDANIYYTPDKEYIGEFRRLIEQRMQENAGGMSVENHKDTAHPGPHLNTGEGPEGTGKAVEPTADNKTAMPTTR